MSQSNEATVPAFELTPAQDSSPSKSLKGSSQGPALMPRGLAEINARTREMATAKLPPSLRAKLEEVRFENSCLRMRGAPPMPCLERRV